MIIQFVAAVSIYASSPDADPGARAKASVDQIRSGVPMCFQEEDALVFVGSTDSSLVECLQSAPSQTRKLRITSNGGDAALAIQAARMVTARNYALIVRGVCFSACANYLVPAARSLEVEPYSIVGLHGAPEEGEAFIKLIQDEVERQQRQAFPDVSEALVAEGRAKMRDIVVGIVASHKQFAIDHDVGGGWYSLKDFHTDVAAFGPNDFAVVDPAYLARHVPQLQVVDFWSPADARDREILAENAHGAALHYRNQAIDEEL
ncbi:hypothetical protein ACIQTU_10020 [Brevundimonas sp. NPDC090276]|uniref:hypothetical protein n=1 Tax=Brevundimonas sp. NPDC090276 TaxID=3363956 RepID=UPI00383BA783